jgi:hypothetical protein
LRAHGVERANLRDKNDHFACGFDAPYCLDTSAASFVRASRSESVSQGKRMAAPCPQARVKGAPDHVYGQPNHQRRNSPMQNRHIIFGAIFSALAFLPGAQAVNPPPDGCYPNFTTAEGCNALFSLTTGAGNTGVGWYSLFSNTTGNFNTGVGAGALALNQADNNTAVALEHCFSTPLAKRTLPLELTRLSITTAAPTTTLSVQMRSLTMWMAPSTTPMGATRSRTAVPPAKIMRSVI